MDAALKRPTRARRRVEDRAALVVPVHELRDFGRRLRRWFRRNARDLPWRRTRDPYRVLVSELMLQQTQVARVIGYYARFLERYPTLESLAAATPRRVREAWSGLGYYARAANLHRLARTLAPRAEPGEVASLPADPEALRKLPGVGPYTAGAVASFAFERRAPLVDTNVARVLRRVFAPRLDPATSSGRRALWALAAASLPRTGRATWTHNQALMELGALICTARAKRCAECPVKPCCATYRDERAPRISRARTRSASPSSPSTRAAPRAGRRSSP